MAECQFRIYRDSLSTPWGFRLQGGKDFKAPLKVQRVFVGSPAEGDLQRGDVILSIDNYDATKMVHKQAMDVIKQAGGTLSLRIKRSPGVRQQPQPPTVPLPKLTPQASQYQSRPTEKLTSPNQAPPMSGFQSYGHDYGGASTAYPARQAQTKPMLDRLQMTLDHATSPPRAYNGDGRGEDEEDYHQASVSDLKKVFNERPRQPEKRSVVKQLKNQYNQTSRAPRVQIPRQKPTVQQQLSPNRAYTYTAKPIWQKPDSEPNYAPPELGWTPKQTPEAWSPVKPPQAAMFRPEVTPQAAPTHRPVNARPDIAPQAAPTQRPVNARPHVSPQAVPPPRAVNAGTVLEPQHTEPVRPAWMGSLKASGGPKPWEMKEAENIAGQGAVSPGTMTAQNIQPHQPRVQNVHYGPGDSAPQYSQHDGGGAPQEENGTAQVKHLQYNSPLGLYSRDNAELALSGQTTGKPGQGTMQVSGGGPPNKAFDPKRSDVYKMLLEEEKGHMSRVSARYQDPNARGEMNYQGYIDQSTRSPAMGRLQQHVADGTSDF